MVELDMSEKVSLAKNLFAAWLGVIDRLEDKIGELRETLEKEFICTLGLVLFSLELNDVQAIIEIIEVKKITEGTDLSSDNS